MARAVQFTFSSNRPASNTVNGLPSHLEIKQRLYDMSTKLAKRMSEGYANQLKITLLRVKKFATGDTFRSVKDEMLLESPSRYLVQRRVVASRSIVNIQLGRAAGLTPPPVSALVKWAQALGIPQASLKRIAQAIGRKGIKPVEVQEKAVRQARNGWKQAIQAHLSAFVRDLFK